MSPPASGGLSLAGNWTVQGLSDMPEALEARACDTGMMILDGASLTAIDSGRGFSRAGCVVIARALRARLCGSDRHDGRDREVDAMRTIAIDPIELLVLPKVLALAIALPLLSVFADVTGVLGGMVMARMQFDIGFSQSSSIASNGRCMVQRC